MNSKERVLTTLNHKEPDKVPIDLGSTDITSISAIAYTNLKKQLGITAYKTKICEVIPQLARVDDAILDLFDIDVVNLSRIMNENEKDWYDVNIHGIDVQYPKWFTPRQNPDGSFEIVHPDGTVLGKMSRNSEFYDQTYYPSADGYPKDYNEFQNHLDKNVWFNRTFNVFDDLNKEEYFKLYQKKASIYQEESNKAFTYSFGSVLFEVASFSRRMDRFLTDMIRKPSKVEKFLDFTVQWVKEELEVVFHYLGDLIDVIRLGDDFGENNGPFFSPRLFRKFIKPRYKEITEFIKRHSKAKIFLHSCGSIKPLINDIIDSGIDILNPVQLSVKNMDPKELKEEFGDDIVFWGGGISTRTVLNKKSPEEVKREVNRLMNIFSPGGGFVFATVHNITSDVPPHNIIAMFEAIHEFNNNL